MPNKEGRKKERKRTFLIHSSKLREEKERRFSFLSFFCKRPLDTRENCRSNQRADAPQKGKKEEEEEEKDWIPLFVLAIFVKGVKGEEMHETS